MKKRLLFILCLTVGLNALSFAQTRTVTNADLEKFRQKRLQAEKEYREKYEELGFPSPEELEKRRVQSQIELEELSERLKEQRLAAQGDWQARAEELKMQIASVEAQLDYLRSFVVEPDRYSGVFAVNVLPRGAFHGGFPNRTGQRVFRGGKPIAVRTSPNLTTGTSVVRRSPRPLQPAVPLLPGIRIHTGALNAPAVNKQGLIFNGKRFPRQGRAPHHFGFFGYGLSRPVDELTLEQNEILAEIRDLEQARAGLYAQMQVLRDAARRAGVNIQ